MDCPDFGVCNPSVIQPNVRRQATFLNRDTESVVALTPNIKLELNLHDQLGNQKRTCDLNSRRLASRRCLLILAPLTGDPAFSGGADRDRTGGLLVANQALSQLSYSPTIKWWAWVELNYRPHPYQGCALAN